MPALVAVDGPLLARVVDALPPAARDGLSAAAFATCERAVQKTTWAQAHRRRVALMDGDIVLATAVCGRLAARLDDRPIQIAAIGSLWADPARDAAAHAAGLIERVIDAERGRRRRPGHADGRGRGRRRRLGRSGWLRAAADHRRRDPGRRVDPLRRADDHGPWRRGPRPGRHRRDGRRPGPPQPLPSHPGRRLPEVRPDAAPAPRRPGSRPGSARCVF